MIDLSMPREAYSTCFFPFFFFSEWWIISSNTVWEVTFCISSWKTGIWNIFKFMTHYCFQVVFPITPSVPQYRLQCRSCCWLGRRQIIAGLCCPCWTAMVVPILRVDSKISRIRLCNTDAMEIGLKRHWVFQRLPRYVFGAATFLEEKNPDPSDSLSLWGSGNLIWVRQTLMRFPLPQLMHKSTPKVFPQKVWKTLELKNSKIEKRNLGMSCTVLLAKVGRTQLYITKKLLQFIKLHVSPHDLLIFK